MEQEAPDELVGGKRHDALALFALAAIILETEADAFFVERDQSPVRDGDAMRVPRQISEHGFGAAGRRLGIDHPLHLADRSQVAEEGTPINQARLIAAEVQPPGVMKFDQLREEEPPEQLGEDTHWQEEGRT